MDNERNFWTFLQNIWDGMGSIFNFFPEYPSSNQWQDGFRRDRINMLGDVRRVFNDLSTAVSKNGGNA